MVSGIYDMAFGTSSDSVRLLADTPLGKKQASDTYHVGSFFSIAGTFMGAMAGIAGGAYLSNKLGIQAEAITTPVILASTMGGGALSAIAGHALTMMNVESAAEEGDKISARIETHKDALGVADVNRLTDDEMNIFSSLMRKTDAVTDTGIRMAKRVFENASAVSFVASMGACIAGLAATANALGGHNLGVLAFPLLSGGALAAAGPVLVASKVATDWLVARAGRKGDAEHDTPGGDVQSKRDVPSQTALQMQKPVIGGPSFTMGLS